MSISNFYRVDNTDQDIMRIMVTKWSTSAYTTWIKMNEEYGENAFSYKNIGKRFVRLAENNVIEEIKLENVENLHGRKDYKVTMKGMEQLIPYIMTHPEDVRTINGYISKFNLDKRLLLKLLIDKFHSGLDSLYVILLTTLVPKIDDSIWTYDVVESMNQLLRNIKRLKEAYPSPSTRPIFRKEGEEPIDLRKLTTGSAHEGNKTVENKKESNSGFRRTIKNTSGRKKKPT
jgi:hypothetical protein